MWVLTCATCRNQLSADPAYVGQYVQCPHCQGPVLVGAPMAQPETPRAPAPHTHPHLPGQAPGTSPALSFEFEGASMGESDSPGESISSPRPPRNNQNAIIYMVCGVCFLLLAGIPMLIHLPRLIAEIQKGSRSLTTTELRNMKDVGSIPERDRWVRYTADKLIDTGIDEVTESGNAKLASTYVVIPIQDRFLIAKVRKVAATTRQLEGTLEVHGADTDEAAMQQIREKYPANQGKWQSFYLRADAGSAGLGPMMVIAICGVGVMIGLGSLLYGWGEHRANQARSRPKTKSAKRGSSHV